MRVIAGVYKGRRLKVPKEASIRPTLDNVREALFNILGGEVVGRKVLDLYAGSGSLGIEAMSRHAEAAAFVDHSPKCIKAINENIESLSLKERTRVLRLDAGRAIRLLEGRGEVFDLILLDPPYGNAEKSLQMISKSGILSPSCRVVVEHHKAEMLSEGPGALRLKKARRHGDTVLSFYKVGTVLPATTI